MESKTSIVILNYNTIDYIQACVESIRAFTEEGRYEIIIVDNGSKDGSVEWLQEQDDLKCIFNKENLGFPKGCNQGMAIATGTEIMLLNSDVIVTPRWHEQMIKALYSSDDIGAVSCMANACSNGQQIDVPYKTMDIDVLLDFAEKYNHSNPSLWTMHFTLVGYCFMFRRSIYEKIGGMDEYFSPGNYEDDDYSFRIMKEGYKLILCKDTFIHHYGSGSFVRELSPEKAREHVEKYNSLLRRNSAYFQEKWHLQDGHYKDLSNELFELEDYIGKNQQNICRVLIVARNRLAYICDMLAVNKGVEVDYLTDSQLDYELMHHHCNIIFCDDLAKGAVQLNASYDGVLIAASITDYSGISELRKTLASHCKGLFIEEK